MLRVEFRQAAAGVAEDLASAGAVRVEESGRSELVNRFEKARHEFVAQPRRRLERISSRIYQRPI